MTIVMISQPMLFPWVGLLEQYALADVCVHYDDVQFSKGSFSNRVQVKTAAGVRWLTVPLAGRKLSQSIRDVAVNDATDWRAEHRALLENAYRDAPHAGEMLELVDGAYAGRAASVCDVAVASTEAVCGYFGIAPPEKFRWSSRLGIAGRGSDRVLAIVKSLGGDVYITGHGAQDYLEHERFEESGVRVEYMDYRKLPYPQLHGPFTPFVTSLDLVAHCGREGRRCIAPATKPWKEFLS